MLWLGKHFSYLFCFFPQLNAFWVGSVQQLGVESCRVETKSRRSIVPNFCGRSLSWQASKTRNIVRSSWGIIESMSTKIKTNCWYLELLILSDSLTQGILRNFPFESSRRSRCWWDYSDLITISRLVSGACDDKLRWNPRGRVNFERKQAHENIFPWSAPQKIRFGCTQKSRSQVAANRFLSGFLSIFNVDEDSVKQCLWPNIKFGFGSRRTKKEIFLKKATTKLRSLYF